MTWKGVTLEEVRRVEPLGLEASGPFHSFLHSFIHPFTLRTDLAPDTALGAETSAEQTDTDLALWELTV